MKTPSVRYAARAWPLPALLLALGVLVFPLGADAQDLNLTGDWVLSVESPNGTGWRDVTFVQDGTELTGEISSSRAAGPLVGTIDGDQVTFVAVVLMDSGPFEITYTGTVTGDEMAGTVEFGTYGSGTFQGRRAEEGRESK